MYVFENLPMTLSHASVIGLRYTIQGNLISTREGLYSKEMKEGADFYLNCLLGKQKVKTTFNQLCNFVCSHSE